MQRRRYIELLGIGTGGALAGRVAAMDEHGENNGENDDDDVEPEDKDQDEDHPLDPCVSNLQLAQSELVHDDIGLSAETYALVDVENGGEAASGKCALEVEWHDEGGARLNNTSESLPWLNAGETWHAAISEIGLDAEEVADMEVVGAYETASPAIPELLTVAESAFKPDDFTSTIEGVVENEAETDVGRVEAHGRVFDEEGRVLAGDSTTEFDLPAGRDWSFEIRLRGLDRPHNVVDHDVTLDVGVLRMSEMD